MAIENPAHYAYTGPPRRRAAAANSAGRRPDHATAPSLRSAAALYHLQPTDVAHGNGAFRRSGHPRSFGGLCGIVQPAHRRDETAERGHSRGRTEGKIAIANQRRLFVVTACRRVVMLGRPF